MYYKIDEELAREANTINSFSEYVQGSATNEYKQVVDEVYQIAEECKQITDDEETISKVNYYADKFAKKYAQWVNKGFRIETYCPSVLIAGRSNFPTSRKEKQNVMREVHLKEYERIMWMKNKILSLKGGTRIIQSRDKDVLVKLENKIKELEDLQKHMTEANRYYRAYKTMNGYKDLSDEEAQKIDETINNATYNCAKKPYPSYLSNNGSEIFRLKARLKSLTEIKSKPTQITENEYFKVVENTELVRIQLFFESKPNETIRKILRANSFKWNYKESYWHRPLTRNGLNSLEVILKGIDEENKKATTMREHDDSSATPNK